MSIDSVGFGKATNIHVSNTMVAGGLGMAFLGIVLAIAGIFVRKEEWLLADESDREYNNVAIEEVQEWYSQIVD